jgi:membrane protein DedA with SNARE-associated domain
MAKWVMDVIYSTGYLGVVLLMFAENVFPPIPSEVIMPLAGFMASQGKFTFAGVVIAGTIGSVLGALPPYYLGRSVGEERLKELANRYGRWLTVSGRDVERAKRWFDRHGAAAVFFCHFIPGVRSLISVPAGFGRMNMAAFLACTAAGSGLWAALLASLGYFLGANFRQVEEYLDPASYFVLAALITLYVVRVLRHGGASPFTGRLPSSR